MIYDYPKLNPGHDAERCSLHQLHYDAALPLNGTRAEYSLKRKYKFHKIPSLLRYYPKTMPSQQNGREICEGLCALGYEMGAARSAGFWNMPQNEEPEEHGFATAHFRMDKKRAAIWLTPPGTDLIISECFFTAMHVYQIEGNAIWLIPQIGNIEEIILPPLPLAQRIHIVRPFLFSIADLDALVDTPEKWRSEGRQVAMVDHAYYTNTLYR